MLGTPNGCRVAKLLTTHKGQIGRRTIESATVWSDPEEEEEDDPNPVRSGTQRNLIPKHLSFLAKGSEYFDALLLFGPHSFETYREPTQKLLHKELSPSKGYIRGTIAASSTFQSLFSK